MRKPVRLIHGGTPAAHLFWKKRYNHQRLPSPSEAGPARFVVMRNSGALILSAFSDLLISEVIWEMLSSDEEVSRAAVLSRLTLRMLAEWDEKRCYAYVMAIRELKKELNEELIHPN